MSFDVPPPIGLKTITISNFRGIGELGLDFRGPDGEPNPLVVLAGPNGSGKTAVLEAALIAVGGTVLAMGPHGRRGIRKGADHYKITGTLRSGLGDHTFVSTSSSPPDEGKDLGVPISYFSSWRAPNLIGSVDVTVGRRGPRRKKNDSNRLLEVKQRLVNAAAAENFSTKPRLVPAPYTTWIRRINEAWSLFYPGRGDSFAVDLADADADVGEKGAFEVYLDRSGMPPLAVDHLSAGQLELFLFLATLVLDDRDEGIVFIDEPELHLDPQWHGAILRALMRLRPAAQFIVATHSPAIYHAAMTYERHLLTPEDDDRVAIWGEAAARG